MECQHYRHSHPLVSNEDQTNPANCVRCGEVVSGPSFSCAEAECEFYLHKKCAETPSQIHHPFHRTHPLVLLQKPPYKASCNFCGKKCELFLYHCSCKLDFHIKCALFSLHIAENKLGELENVAIKDPLVSTEDEKKGWYYVVDAKDKVEMLDDDGSLDPITRVIEKNEGSDIKDINTLSSLIVNMKDSAMLALPLTSRHKCDEHPLALTYHESNDYSKYHRCDICEEKRDPKFWFYHCATCDTSAHPRCVLGRYPFIKAGSVYKEKDHPHPLIFVRKANNYPAACRKCCEPCQDLALECPESTCNYIVHWQCVKPPDFSYDRPIALYKTGEDAMADDNLKEPFSSSLEIKDEYKIKKFFHLIAICCTPPS
ncbi:hypothetical protein PTKIN_Ptkin09bG0047100 [Pterospermum kingtungense]